jgi:hypothetical protein
MLSWKERQERIEARGAEYRAGAMTEDQFRAYLFGMRLRGQDITHELGNYFPPAPAQTFEERRMEASRLWIRSYHGR